MNKSEQREVYIALAEVEHFNAAGNKQLANDYLARALSVLKSGRWPTDTKTTSGQKCPINRNNTNDV